jgi:molybdopterin molybdotransferase
MFDRIAILDWSASGVPKTGKDSIWIGVTNASGTTSQNIATRAGAEAAILTLAQEAVRSGERLLIGADLNFGAPAGLAKHLTGKAEAKALWGWLAERITDDTRNRSNYREVAAEMNARLPGGGPFWGNGSKAEVQGLPRTKPSLPNWLYEHRRCDQQSKAEGLQPKTLWQLAGAGAVGAQSLLGMPMLHRLSAALGADCAVWPFEPIEGKAVVIAEIYAAFIGPDVKAAEARGKLRDAAEVELLSASLWSLGRSGRLGPLFEVEADPTLLREEGWTLGTGHGPALRAAIPASQLPPRLRDDCFAMPQGVAWVPVDDALDRLRAALAPVTGFETMQTAKASGRVLAADCVARRSNPPRPNSAVDGYGFAHAATQSGVNRLPLVVGRAAAGQPFEGAVPAGYAVRILTGAILPEGVDTVVLEEDCAADSASVTFDGPVKLRANTRKAGEDVAEGAVALAAGHRLQPPDLALLSALGIAEVTVHRLLRVGVLSTGDEIIPSPETPALPHQIYDANRPMLLSLISQWGHEAVDLGHAPDRPAVISGKLDRAAREVDVVITSGGASAGDEDHVSRLLREQGTLSSWRIAMKPGRPLALAIWKGIPVIGLPGNPVAALVCALIFGRPALSKLAGGGWSAPLGFTVPAAFTKSKKPGRREYLRARINAEGAAEVFASEGSGRISGLSWADGIVELPDGAAEIAPGAPVRYIPYGSFGLT